MTEHAKFVWWNGRVVPWSEAMVHATALGWSTIGGVFEGIKAYWNAESEQLYALHFGEHYERFMSSMRLQHMRSEWDAETFVDASFELLRANGVKYDVYIRPIAYFGETTWFSTSLESPTEVFIWTTAFASGLGSGQTLRACVSSWTRLSDNMMSPRIKCLSNYQNSRMALIEAKRNGYDTPILLNDRQKVTEGPASCVFVVRGGVAVTPAISSGILESVTRKALLQLCKEQLDIPCEEREVDRTELYVADEIFLCGTGSEVQPITEIDGYRVGGGVIGPITSRIERTYHDIVRGKSQAARWAVPVYRTVPAD